MAVKTVTATINGQTYTLTLNSATGKYEAAVTAPAQSSYSQPDHVFGVQLSATDDAGNVTNVDASDPTLGSKLRLRVLERNAPTIAPAYPAAGAHITTSVPTIKWKVLDDDSGVNTAALGLSVNGVTVDTAAITITAIEGGVECSYTPTAALPEGENMLAFTGQDNDGNAATGQTLTFAVDTVAPSLNVSEPADGAAMNSATIHVIGSTNDESSKPVTVTIEVNGVDQGTVTLDDDGSFDKVVTLTAGNNTITVKATDASDQATTVTRTVVLDTAAPQFSNLTVSPNPVDAGMTFIISVTVTDV